MNDRRSSSGGPCSPHGGEAGNCSTQPENRQDTGREGRGERVRVRNVALTRESKPEIEELCQQKTPTNDLLSIADNSGPDVGAPL